ncbi:MAG: hypothetical protein NTW87_11625 [Planctomycetota bacterium]|nr:hypothetical protein [Planctomycetota bacterium]
MRRTPELSQLAQCVCGRLCTSGPGLTLHQRRCGPAIEARAQERPTNQPIILDQPDAYSGQIKAFWELADLAAYDAERAIHDGNQSAARRARVRLNELRRRIPALRRVILAAAHRSN